VVSTPQDPANLQNPNVITVAYGTITNVREPIETPQDVDIYLMVSLDNGLSWTRAQAITVGDVENGFPDEAEDFETQLKIRPDGLEGHVVWSTAVPSTVSPGTTVDAVSYRRYQLLEDALFRDGFEELTPPVRLP
jgi:hypothetical protein